MIKLANAPVSWGVIEFDLEGEVSGYAQVLDEIRETDYVGTELGDWGFLPTDPNELTRELEARDLSLLAAFVPVALANADSHADGEANALRTAQLLAAVAGESAFIVLADDSGTVTERTENAGRIQPQHGMREEQWKAFADGTHRIASTVRDQTGLRTVFHHHCAGYIETPAEIDKLLNLTDPALVGLCFDTGHYAFGGGDVVEGAGRYGERIWHVHFKDCHPEVAGQSRSEGWDYFESIRQGVFCELGKGIVDFPTVLASLRELGYDGWAVVEQDIIPGLGTPKESAQRNRDYLRSISI